MTHEKENNVHNGNNNEHTTTSAEIPQKQKFKSLDGVLGENNYDDAPPQGHFTFEYIGSEKRVEMTWKSTKNGDIHKQGSENICKHNPGPTRPAELVKSPFPSFKFFFTYAIITQITVSKMC